MTAAGESYRWSSIYSDLGVSIPATDARPLSAFVEQYAKDMPQATALRYFARTFSYSELNSEANKLANALVACGVERGDVVGFHMPNIPQYAIALVAISKLGCIGSGVSPLLAPSELAHQIDDAQIKVLISFDALVDSVLGRMSALPSCLEHILVTGAMDFAGGPISPGPDIKGVKTAALMRVLHDQSSEFVASEADENATFLIQYTGGTTGRPKGAMLSVAGIMGNLPRVTAYQDWQPGQERVATAFPFFHIAGASLICCALRYGAEVFLIPDPRDLQHFCAQMSAYPPTVIAAVPSLYQMLTEFPAIKDVDFSQLKCALSGAAPLTDDNRKKIEDLIGPEKLSDVFGMTETSPTYVVNPPKRYKPGCVGIPVPGVDVRIVDVETGTRELGADEVGEIITSGPHVMQGYLNLPEETAIAIRELDGKRWMYTGDVGSMDTEGYIKVCDRAKDMLIVGGFKVFSVEVEDKLAQLPEIAQTALIGTPDSNRHGNDVVNLFVELAPEFKAADADALKTRIIDFCRAEMAPYKVPKKIHFIDQIPLTPVGKLDKKVLRAQALDMAAEGS